MIPTLLRYEFGRDPCSESCSKRHKQLKNFCTSSCVVAHKSVHIDFGIPNEILKIQTLQ